jgi:restriction system protein
MGRQRSSKTSGATAVMDLVALLPWWLGVALAIGAYLGLRAYVSHPPPLPEPSPGTAGTIAIITIKTTLASVGQYLLPALCLLGAVASAIRRHKRQTLARQAAAQQDPAQALHGMSWREFEQLVGQAFRQRGYQVSESGGNGPDGGIDLVLRKGSEKLLVQCKQWRATTVGVEIVRELYGLIAAEGAIGGYVVTADRYSRDASEFAQGRNIQLIDGATLHGWLQQARTQQAPPRIGAEKNPVRAPAVSGKPIDLTRPPPISPVPTDNPACPLCGKPMLRRLAKRGTNAGLEFWGCGGYPGCRGTRGLQ